MCNRLDRTELLGHEVGEMGTGGGEKESKESKGEEKGEEKGREKGEEKERRREERGGI